MTSNQITALARSISSVIPDYIPVTYSHLIEAVARGDSANTGAALRAARDSQPPNQNDFDAIAFYERLADFLSPIDSKVVSALINGFGLDIVVAKRDVQPLRFGDIAYDVTASLRGAALDAPAIRAGFVLPERIQSSVEPYRLDSAASHRLVSDTSKRSKVGDRLLSARWIDGHWQGGLYVYAVADQVNDSTCVKWAKAGLMRAVLPAMAPAVYCDVYRPAAYAKGCWRIRLNLTEAVRKYWGQSPFTFTLPRLAHHHFDIKPGFLGDILPKSERWIGRFADGKWLCDLSPNGQLGLENPVSIQQVQAAMQRSLNDLLHKAGFFNQRSEQLVTRQ